MALSQPADLCLKMQETPGNSRAGNGPTEQQIPNISNHFAPPLFIFKSYLYLLWWNEAWFIAESVLFFQIAAIDQHKLRLKNQKGFVQCTAFYLIWRQYLHFIADAALFLPDWQLRRQHQLKVYYTRCFRFLLNKENTKIAMISLATTKLKM